MDMGMELKWGDTTDLGKVDKVLSLFLDLSAEAGIIIHRQGVTEDLHT